jgi:hypothetical protein
LWCGVCVWGGGGSVSTHPSNSLTFDRRHANRGVGANLVAAKTDT